MPTVVQCNRCLQRFASADHLLGTTVPCPTCGNAIVIPHTGPQSVLPAASNTAVDPRLLSGAVPVPVPRPLANSASTGPWVWILAMGVVASALVVVGIIAARSFFPSHSNSSGIEEATGFSSPSDSESPDSTLPPGNFNQLPIPASTGPAAPNHSTTNANAGHDLPNSWVKGDVAWKVPVETPQASSQTLLTRPISLGDVQVEEGLFESSGKLVVLQHKQLNRDNLYLDQYDLSDGHRAFRVKVPTSSKLMAVGPGGELVALSVGGRLESVRPDPNAQLEIWSLSTGERIANLTSGTIANASGAGQSAETVPYVAFPDAEHVLTYGSGKKLVLWNLADLSSRYVVHSDQPPVLAPNRRSVAICSKSRVRLVDSLTGLPQGEVTWAGNSEVQSLGPFRSDNQQFVHSTVDGLLVVTNLRNGTSADANKAARQPPRFWLGDYLWCGLAQDFEIMSPKLGIVVWRIQFSRNIAGGVVPMSGSWWTLLKGSHVSFAVPLSRNSIGLPEQLEERAERDGVVLLAPGADVSVDVLGIPEESRERVRSMLANTLRGRGLQVVDAAAAVLTATVRDGESKTVQYAEYNKPRRGMVPEPTGKMGSITVTEKIFQLNFVHRSTNTTFWSVSGRSSGERGGDVEGSFWQSSPTTVSNAVAKKQLMNMLHFFEHTQVPARVLREPTAPDGGKGYGSSAIRFQEFEAEMIAEEQRILASRKSERSSPVERVAPRRSGKIEHPHDVYADLLAGDGTELKRRLRWCPGAKRPLLPSRWGIGLNLTGEKLRQPPQFTSRFQLRNFCGELGVVFERELSDRLRGKSYGEWPGSAFKFRELEYLGAGATEDLEREARRVGVNVLVVMDVQVKIGSRRQASMSIRIRDLLERRAEVVSPAITDRQVAAASDDGSRAVGQLLTEFLEQMDAAYTLKHMPDITQEVASKRAASLGESEIRDPFGVLLELRYYQVSNLLSADNAARYYDVVLGDGKGKILASGTEAERYEMLDDWIKELP